MNADTWDFYSDKSEEWRWTRTAANGEIVGAATEGYANKADCEANAKRNGHGGCSTDTYKTDKWEFYADKSGDHRWRRTAPNGNIVGASSQGYANKADCEANARRHCWAG